MSTVLREQNWEVTLHIHLTYFYAPFPFKKGRAYCFVGQYASLPNLVHLATGECLIDLKLSTLINISVQIISTFVRLVVKSQGHFWTLLPPREYLFHTITSCTIKAFEVNIVTNVLLKHKLSILLFSLSFISPLFTVNFPFHLCFLCCLHLEWYTLLSFCLPCLTS